MVELLIYVFRTLFFRTLAINYLISSLDKAVIVDNEKVLTHMLKAGGKKAKTLIVTNSNDFC